MCWISVSTQKPEEGAYVDCWIKGDSAARGIRRIGVLFEDDDFYLPAGDYDCTVTHWRYPPAPPEGV
jgi:hypothetical protein